MAALLICFSLLKPGPVRGWIVAPDHELTERVWREVVKYLFEDLKFSWRSRRDHPPREFTLEDGSYLGAKSTEHSARKNLVGDALDFLVWDECAKSPGSLWETRLQPNLIGRDSWALLISTPDGNNHFCEWWERGQKGRKGYHAEWESWQFPSSVNDRVEDLPMKIEEARATFSPEAFAQEYEAQFTTFAGRVYSEFDELKHVRECAYDPALPLYLSFDFGVENPFVCLWIQVTPGDQIRIIDEYVQTGWSTLENGNAVLAQHMATERKDWEWAAADPSGKDERLTLQRHVGIHTKTRRLATGKRRDQREIPARIEAIRRLLKQDRLVVDPSCEVTVNEFLNYRYPENPEDRNANEMPIKANDHALDALGYFYASWKPFESSTADDAAETIRADIAANAPPVRIRTARERLLNRSSERTRGWK